MQNAAICWKVPLITEKNVENGWEVCNPSIICTLTHSLGSKTINLTSRSARLTATYLMLLKIIIY